MLYVRHGESVVRIRTRPLKLQDGDERAVVTGSQGELASWQLAALLQTINANYSAKKGEAMTPLDLSKFDGITPGPWHSHRNTILAEHKNYAGNHTVTELSPRADGPHLKNRIAIAAVPELIAELKACREALAGAVNGHDDIVSSELPLHVKAAFAIRFNAGQARALLPET